MENTITWLKAYLVAFKVIILSLDGHGVTSLCQCSEWKIDCRFHNLTSLSWKSSAKCNYVKESFTFSLDLSHNNITLEYSESNTEYLRNVLNLDISFNNIWVLGRFVDSNENLGIKVFNFSNNCITALEKNTFKSFTILQVLDFSNNQIVTIEYGTFSSLLKLEYVNLSSNALTFLNISCPDVLKHLNLKDNKLTTIVLHGKHYFQFLDLSCNNFSSFPFPGEDWPGEIVFGGNPTNCTMLLNRYDIYRNLDCTPSVVETGCIRDSTTQKTTPVATVTTTKWKTEANENKEDFQQVEVPTDESPNASNLMLAVISINSALLVFFILLAIVVFLRNGRFRATNRKVEMEEISLKEEDASELENEVDFLIKDKEVSHDKVILYEKLGEGEFGVVYKGVVHGINHNNKKVICAVKMPKVGALYEAKEDLLSEMKLVADLGDHQNILSLIACCSRREPYYLITEFMKFGDLLTFLRRCRQRNNGEEDSMYRIEETKQVFIAYEIAKGMAYIQGKQFYHGDLAARNILVGDGLRIKISDFGLADDVYTRGYKRLEVGQKIPIKWCSLETILNGICTSQGDVWSYGVLLYEVFTLGGTPYPGIAARYLVSQLRKGYRMEQPENCPDDIYELMLTCWQEDPNERPTFHVIREQLDTMLIRRADYLKFEQEDEYFNDTTRASYLSNTYMRNITLTSPVRYEDENNPKVETFAPILEEENGIELTELEAIIRDNEQ